MQNTWSIGTGLSENTRTRLPTSYLKTPHPAYFDSTACSSAEKPDYIYIILPLATRFYHKKLFIFVRSACGACAAKFCIVRVENLPFRKVTASAGDCFRRERPAVQHLPQAIGSEVALDIRENPSISVVDRYLRLIHSTNISSQTGMVM